MTSSPFDHRPDVELGRVLREALAGQDDAGFMRRVLAAADEVYGAGLASGNWWDVLTGWARPGLAAAAALAVAATLWLVLASSVGSRDVTLDDVFRPGGEVDAPAMLVAEVGPPDLDQLLAAALGER